MEETYKFYDSFKWDYVVENTRHVQGNIGSLLIDLIRETGITV